MNPRLVWEVARAEGPAAVRDRLLDRLAGWRRRRAFRRMAVLDAHALTTAAEPDRPISVLNILPTPPRPDFGGVQAQLLRRLEAEAELRPWALLAPDGAGWRLEIRDGEHRRAIDYRAATLAADDVLEDSRFEAVVLHAARAVGADVLHVEQPAGLPLASVLRLRRRGLQQVISVHDFALFCPRPHLLEIPHLRFCDFSTDAHRCRRCLGHDWNVAAGFQERRREIGAEILRRAEAVVYPSDWLRSAWTELVPELDRARQRVVPPAAVRGPTAARPPRNGPIRHVAFVGAVNIQKGALVFEALLDHFPPERHPALVWSVFGGGDREILRRLQRRPALRVRGYYRTGRLVELLRRRRVDLALLLSITPESYGMTLDECRLAGVPVLAFDQGAVGERLRKDGGVSRCRSTPRSRSSPAVWPSFWRGAGPARNGPRVRFPTRPPLPGDAPRSTAAFSDPRAMRRRVSGYTPPAEEAMTETAVEDTSDTPETPNELDRVAACWSKSVEARRQGPIRGWLEAHSWPPNASMRRSVAPRRSIG